MYRPITDCGIVSSTVPPEQQLLARGNDPESIASIAMDALMSPHFSKLDNPGKVAWLFSVFQAAVVHALKETPVLRNLIHYHSVSIFRDQPLSLADACRLTEAIHGINWAGAANLAAMKDYNTFGVRRFRDYVLSHPETQTKAYPPGDPGRPPRKIAYLCHYADFTRGNAIGPMILDVMSRHAAAGRSEILTYCVQWCHPEYLEALNKYAIPSYQMDQQLHFSGLCELRDALRLAAPDAVISDVASPIATWLYVNRVAPLQLYLDPGYPHWDLPELDWILLAGKNHQPTFGIPADRCSTLRLRLSRGTFAVQRPNLTPLASGLPQAQPGRFRFAAVTRLVKITDAWVDMAIRLLAECPDASLLIVGPGNPELLKRLLDTPSLQNRVNFINSMVDLREVSTQIDAQLDTFPFIGGLVCSEFMSMGIPVIGLKAGEWDRHLEETRDPSTTAANVDEFISQAIRLATDRDFYTAACDRAKIIAGAQNDPADMIQDIETGIARALESRRAIESRH